ncbi:hypothetical protein JTE90_013261 [Oedothorax gibbosus]|uniref:Vitellogenin n=1 Tax=Oedothorax gibbosus TaxID=931172 RepID=A0AAV6VCX8_9ARAC|nr:hypothetical protein JTE90_013261 [Oedothorax gibbosus]
MNAYHYMLPLLPIGHVHFLGMKILPEETLFGPQKKIALLAWKAANILRIERVLAGGTKVPAEWVPIQMVFAAINDSKNVKVIAPKPDSMISFTMENILINENLPDQPWLTHSRRFVASPYRNTGHEHLPLLVASAANWTRPFSGMKILPEETLFEPQKKIGLFGPESC